MSSKKKKIKKIHSMDGNNGTQSNTVSGINIICIWDSYMGALKREPGPEDSSQIFKADKKWCPITTFLSTERDTKTYPLGFAVQNQINFSRNLDSSPPHAPMHIQRQCPCIPTYKVIEICTGLFIGLILPKAGSVQSEKIFITTPSPDTQTPASGNDDDCKTRESPKSNQRVKLKV